MNTFTKGPWLVSHRDSESYVFTLENDTNPVAHVYCVYGNDREANARLIAAAPDLLKALIDVIPDLERFVSKQGPGPDKRLERAKTALNKAGVTL